MTPEEMVARLLYRDGLMLVVDKPAGLAVHRGPKAAGMKTAPALEDYFDALRFGLPRAPSLAHRLDRETAGCLVLGRHRKALETLGKLFKEGRVGKTYWAIVEGTPDAEEGTIDLPLAKRDRNRGWWMKVDPAGMPALTKWKVMGRASAAQAPIASPFAGEAGRRSPHPNPSPQAGEEMDGAKGEAADRASGGAGEKQLTWLALEPVTGRTHQLRVHCAAMGWPILGDSIYGNAPRFGGPALHLLSREIVVPLYKSRDPVRVIAPVPPQMREAAMSCGWKNDDGASISAHSRESGKPEILGPRLRGGEGN
jgi:tRNA pseudouridine32 synthase/23S rRNA pseudouridine746 synthase